MSATTSTAATPTPTCASIVSLVGGDAKFARAGTGLAAFGHTFSALLFGIDAALRTGATVLLDDEFWDGIQGGRYSTTPEWPWSILRFNRTSEASELGLPNLTRFGFSSGRNHKPPHEVLISLDAAQLENLGMGVPYAKYVQMSQQDHGVCGKWVHVHAGYRSCVYRHPCCPGARSVYCTRHLPGAFERVSSSPVFAAAVTAFRAKVLTHARRANMLAAFASPRASAGARPRATRPIRVVWHLRVGDVRSHVSEDILQWIHRSLLTPRLSRRSVTHLVLSANATAAAALWPSFAPWMSNDDALSMGSGEHRTVIEMASADVLIVAGSSFGYAAAAVAPAGQLFLYLPPKEMYPEFARLNPSAETEGAWLGREGLDFYRRNMAWRTYFVRRNTVPLSAHGRPFADYQEKLEAMLGAIDRGERPDEAISSSCSRADAMWLSDPPYVELP